MKDASKNPRQAKNTLVIGGNGKTGRRVVARLKARDIPVRIGSRAGEPPFDWEDPTTWEAVLRGMVNVYHNPAKPEPKRFTKLVRYVIFPCTRSRRKRWRP